MSVLLALEKITSAPSSVDAFWRLPAGHCTFKGHFHPHYCGFRGYHILPLSKLDGVAFVNGACVRNL